MRILAISGSLRAASSNTSALLAATILAPPEMEIVLYQGLGDLPHFNPDLDNHDAPRPAIDLRREIALSDGLLICSPEYAHGVSGVMKNALDWLVSSEEFPGMPVALINASPRAVHAQAHIRETLTVMSAHIVEEASISIPVQGRNLSPAGIAADPLLSAQIRGALDALGRSIRSLRSVA